jgi:hypothetical protein
MNSAPMLTFSTIDVSQLTQCQSQSQSQSHIKTNNQNLHVKPTSGAPCHIYVTRTVAGLLMWGDLSDRRLGLSFTTADDPCHHIYYRVQAPLSPQKRTHDHILLPQDLRLLQPGGPGPCNYILKEQGGSVISPKIGFIHATSYNLQGYSGGIRTCIHAGFLTQCSNSLHGTHRKHNFSVAFMFVGML